jgi:hypothetical protein
MPIQATVTQFAGGGDEFINQGAHGVADYLYWMCGKFGLEAQEILNIQTPGGQVMPGQNQAFLPLLVTANDFEPDGVTYNNPALSGVNVMIYINNYSSSWYNASSGAFIYTGSGIKIMLPGFNIFSGSPAFSVVIQQNNI